MHFDEIAAAMDGCGNQEVAKLFRQLAGFSRLHLAEAKSRAGAIDCESGDSRLNMCGPITRRRSARLCGLAIRRFAGGCIEGGVAG